MGTAVIMLMTEDCSIDSVYEMSCRGSALRWWHILQFKEEFEYGAHHIEAYIWQAIKGVIRSDSLILSHHNVINKYKYDTN